MPFQPPLPFRCPFDLEHALARIFCGENVPIVMKVRTISVIFTASLGCTTPTKLAHAVSGESPFNSFKNLRYNQSGQAALAADLFVPSNSDRQHPSPLFVVFNGVGGS